VIEPEPVVVLLVTLMSPANGTPPKVNVLVPRLDACIPAAVIVSEPEPVVVKTRVRPANVAEEYG
jgi:hypothetical protein